MIGWGRGQLCYLVKYHNNINNMSTKNVATDHLGLDEHHVWNKTVGSIFANIPCVTLTPKEFKVVLAAIENTKLR